MSELTAEEQDWRLEAQEQRAMAEAARSRENEARAEARRFAAQRDALHARLDAALAELAKYEPSPGCCTACNGVGTVPTGYPCEDCYATGHCHLDTVTCVGQPVRPSAAPDAELTWRRLRMDEVLAEIDNYDGPTDPAELPEDSEGRNILDRIRALMQGDQPTEPPRRRPHLIAPDDPCQDCRCSRIDGRCVGSHCGRCNKPSSSQGHYTSFCSNAKGGTKHHFCCPDDCELAAEPTGEADRG